MGYTLTDDSVQVCRIRTRTNKQNDMLGPREKDIILLDGEIDSVSTSVNLDFSRDFYILPVFCQRIRRVRYK